MKDFLVKLYQRATLPLYERLHRELVWLLQDTSRAYVEQHEHLNITLIDELTKLSIRLDRLENTNLNGTPIPPVGPADYKTGNVPEENAPEIIASVQPMGEQQLDRHAITTCSQNAANNNDCT
jgi:hypothetical protein